MSYYQRHVFFCLNQRINGEACCADHNARAAFDYAKQRVRELGLEKTRINKAGCLDRCGQGPVLVVYPEAVWYSYIDNQDIEEIIVTHLQNGKVVDRLLLPE